MAVTKVTAKAALAMLNDYDELIGGFGKALKNFKVFDSQTVKPAFHCGLAAKFGDNLKDGSSFKRMGDNLKDGSSFKRMDDELKVIISGTLREFGKNPEALKNWKDIMNIMSTNSLLEEFEPPVHREVGYTIDETNWLKLDGDVEPEKVQHFKNWFTNELIQDGDVIQDTKIDIVDLANVLAQTGARVDDVITIFFKDERHEKSVIDVGIIRFPDIDHPYIKVYRIQVRVWSICKRTMIVQEDHNGCSGVFDCAKFMPRADIIDGLESEVRQCAIDEAESLFA